MPQGSILKNTLSLHTANFSTKLKSKTERSQIFLETHTGTPLTHTHTALLKKKKKPRAVQFPHCRVELWGSSETSQFPKQKLWVELSHKSIENVYKNSKCVSYGGPGINTKHNSPTKAYSQAQWGTLTSTFYIAVSGHRPPIETKSHSTQQEYSN